MALNLINIGGVSFRSVSKIFLILKLTFNLNVRVPSHTTVLNWVKKIGIANFRNKDFFKSGKWILIIDESIQFGNKKLLAVVAVSSDKQSLGRALNFEDLVPLVLKTSVSWKSEEIANEIRACIDFEQILYIVSDNGNNFKKCYGNNGLKHIEDVGHMFSWIIKEVYAGKPDFENYTKRLSTMRGKLTLSKYSHIMPPNQRVVSRFMNLTPLFKWGCKMIELLKKDLLNHDEREKVEFVLENIDLIQQTHQILKTLNKIQQLLKNNGFSRTTTDFCIQLLEKHDHQRGKELLLRVRKYFETTLQKMDTEQSIICSSDILESCFGKYKSVVKANKSVGITDLCLCISALLGNSDIEYRKQAMADIKTIHIKQWKKLNIGETLFEKRNKLYKKAG